jgi:hypothetical protein
MVTNSFGKRNFIQPMGRPKHALKVPWPLFPFKFEGVGGGGGAFPGSQCVSLCFQWVPIKFPMCSPTCSP